MPQIQIVPKKTWNQIISGFSQMNLFHTFYTLMGFIITTSLFVASFMSFCLHPEYLPQLFGAAAASAAAWGLAWGAWDDNLRMPWGMLATLATIAMLAGGFVSLVTQHDFNLLCELFGGALGVMGFWALLRGLKCVSW